MIKKIRLFQKRFTPVYSRNLIKHLIKEHKQLMKLINSLEHSLLISKEMSLKRLEKFRYEFELHVLLEHKKLYTMLSAKYRPCGLKKIEEIKSELNKIIELFGKLEDKIHERKIKEAKLLLNTVKKYLIKRIEFEEKILYKLYEHDYTCDELDFLLSKTS
jgi:hypothetical protein